MRVWLYARLSRDDDQDMNSLENQRQLIREYAEKNGYEIVGESFDDNISGMHFNRPGIEEITSAVEEKRIDAVIVKDMSRLGRHRTHTAIYLDFLREREVRVLSVTENFDTSKDADDLMIGFKGLFNDMYVRDIACKIHAGYEQKQKDGIVVVPPFGYYKDKNSGEIRIVPDHAAIVRRIFELYVGGYGIKAIAAMFNEEGVPSPGALKQRLYAKPGREKSPKPDAPKSVKLSLWENTAVKRILQNEFYCGTLVCHKTYVSKINHIKKEIPPEEQYRHENAVPAIVSREIWEQAQLLLSEKPKRNVRASAGKPCHRYAGLIKCGDCNASFVCRTRKWGDKPDRYEYTCNGNHRYGKSHCTPHTIREEVLDDLIYQELLDLKRYAKDNFAQVDRQLKNWLAHRPSAEKKLQEMENSVNVRQKDLEGLLLERIRDPGHAEIYTKMIADCEGDIADLQTKIEDFKNLDETVRQRKKEMKKSMDLLDAIVAGGAVSDANLRMLVDKIVIFDVGGRLKVQIFLNGDFRRKIDCFDESGNLTDHIAEGWWYEDDDTWAKMPLTEEELQG